LELSCYISTNHSIELIIKA